MAATTAARRDEGAFLAELAAEGAIDAASLARLAMTSQKTGEAICRLIPKLGLMEERALAERAARFLGVPLFERNDPPDEAPFRDALNAQFLIAEGLAPVRLDGGRLLVAAVDPFSEDNRQAMELACRTPTVFVVATASDIDFLVKRLYENPDETAASAAPTETDQGYEEDLQRLRDLAAEAPVIRFVNQLFQEAVEKRASDIHIEPFQGVLRVRLRVDGLLREAAAPLAGQAAAIISRVKLLAQLNIAERRLPQDGRIRTVIKGKTLDVRVSTVPTLNGESVVMRLLDKTSMSFDFGELGLFDEDLRRYLGVLSNPNGVILVTGPTGSGKTTTLYASLLHLNQIETKILTVEEPVEYELPGINQIQVKPQIGLTFASALRALVRQDPDVILVGEVRDLETAEIAAQSALTGHRVLSTLHTNDAASSITRLIDMGLPDFLIAATLRGVVAQRLVRRLCERCKIQKSTPPEMLLIAEGLGGKGSLAGRTVFEPRGCSHCDGTGYRGRIGIYEVLVVTDQLRDMIASRAPVPEIHAEALAGGMTTLFDDGMRKVAAGLTSAADVFRATREA